MKRMSSDFRNARYPTTNTHAHTRVSLSHSLVLQQQWFQPEPFFPSNQASFCKQQPKKKADPRMY